MEQYTADNNPIRSPGYIELVIPDRKRTFQRFPLTLKHCGITFHSSDLLLLHFSYLNGCSYCKPTVEYLKIVANEYNFFLLVIVGVEVTRHGDYDSLRSN